MCRNGGENNFLYVSHGRQMDSLFLNENEINLIYQSFSRITCLEKQKQTNAQSQQIYVNE